jgi:hypothetical protein
MLSKIIAVYPLPLQICICSMDSYIGAHVPDHLLSNDLQDMIYVVFVIRIHMVRLCNIKFNIVSKEFINNT